MSERERKLEAALREVMLWIDGWSPNFTQDSEWPETEQRVYESLEVEV